MTSENSDKHHGNTPKTHKQPSIHPGFFAGLFMFGLIFLLPPPEGLSDAAWRTAAVTVMMAVWWISEAIPIFVTALVPVALFPLLGIASVGEATSPYANPVIYLFLGGFLIAAAMERWSLHRRFALTILQNAGTKPTSVILGFLVSSAVLSMFVSNTATAIMMLPMAVSVFDLVSHQPEKERKNFEIGLVLSVAYGCNAGGIGTLIGTPPNALLAGFFQENYGIEIGFLDWMLVGLPIVAVSLPVIHWMLTRVLFPIHIEELRGGKRYIQQELTAMGPMSVQERRVGLIFLMAALGWVFRPIMNDYIPALSGLSDAGIAIGAAMLLFVIPSGMKLADSRVSAAPSTQTLPSDDRFQRTLLQWEHAAKIPWGVLILFGGGLSMASAIQTTGLARWMGMSLEVFGGAPVFGMMFLVVLTMIFVTELTSNTASTAAFLPVLAALAIGVDADPLLFAAPAAIAASCAFMLPVATPPNAIVYSTGKITIREMARAGLWLNVIFSVLITVAAYALISWVFLV